MKAIFSSVLLLAAGLCLVGCESELPPNPNTEAPLRRGISGQGKIVPIDHSNDPLIQETSGPAVQQPN